MNERLAGDHGRRRAERGAHARRRARDHAPQGTAAARLVVEMTDGSLPTVAAQRLVEMEARDTTSSAKIAELIRGLREQAEHDVIAPVPGAARGRQGGAARRSDRPKREQLVSAHGEQVHRRLHRRLRDRAAADGRAPVGHDRRERRLRERGDAERARRGRRADGARRRAALRDPQEGRRQDRGRPAEAQRTESASRRSRTPTSTKFDDALREAHLRCPRRRGRDGQRRHAPTLDRARARRGAGRRRPSRRPGRRSSGGEQEVDCDRQGRRSGGVGHGGQQRLTGALREIGGRPRDRRC